MGYSGEKASRMFSRFYEIGWQIDCDIKSHSNESMGKKKILKIFCFLRTSIDWLKLF